MSKHQIVFTRQAEKSLDLIAKSQPKLLKHIILAIDELGAHPELGKLLKGDLAGLLSHRVGDYRIIYQIRQSKLVITVIDIGHRRNIYK